MFFKEENVKSYSTTNQLLLTNPVSSTVRSVSSTVRMVSTTGRLVSTTARSSSTTDRLVVLEEFL